MSISPSWVSGHVTYGSVCAGDLLEWDATVLESLVHTLKQLSLLRIHDSGLGWGDAEKWRVKVECVVRDEVCAFRLQRARPTLLRVEAINVEA